MPQTSGPKTFIAIRPYREAIRVRVFALLQRLGYAATPALAFPDGTLDEDIMSGLRKAAVPHLLLVPYNARRDDGQGRSDGLEIALRIRRELPAFAQVPMIAPVSQVGAAGFQLRISALAPGALGTHIVVREPELDDIESLAARLAALGI